MTTLHPKKNQFKVARCDELYTVFLFGEIDMKSWLSD